VFSLDTYVKIVLYSALRMRQKPLQILFSWFLLVAVLSVLCDGACRGAHAMDSSGANGPTAVRSLTADHGCPCCPDSHHDSDDVCDDCVNCLCHASITPQGLLLSYLPVFSEIVSSDSFKFLPEVYLPKFVPPQSQA